MNHLIMTTFDTLTVFIGVEHFMCLLTRFRYSKTYCRVLDISKCELFLCLQADKLFYHYMIKLIHVHIAIFYLCFICVCLVFKVF